MILSIKNIYMLICIVLSLLMYSNSVVAANISQTSPTTATMTWTPVSSMSTSQQRYVIVLTGPVEVNGILVPNFTRIIPDQKNGTAYIDGNTLSYDITGLVSNQTYTATVYFYTYSGWGHKFNNHASSDYGAYAYGGLVAFVMPLYPPTIKNIVVDGTSGDKLTLIVQSQAQTSPPSPDAGNSQYTFDLNITNLSDTSEIFLANQAAAITIPFGTAGTYTIDMDLQQGQSSYYSKPYSIFEPGNTYQITVNQDSKVNNFSLPSGAFTRSVLYAPDLTTVNACQFGGASPGGCQGGPYTSDEEFILNFTQKTQPSGAQSPFHYSLSVTDAVTGSTIPQTTNKLTSDALQITFLPRATQGTLMSSAFAPGSTYDFSVTVTDTVDTSAFPSKTPDSSYPSSILRKTILYAPTLTKFSWNDGDDMSGVLSFETKTQPALALPNAPFSYKISIYEYDRAALKPVGSSIPVQQPSYTPSSQTVGSKSMPVSFSSTLTPGKSYGLYLEAYDGNNDTSYPSKPLITTVLYPPTNASAGMVDNSDHATLTFLFTTKTQPVASQGPYKCLLRVTDESSLNPTPIQLVPAACDLAKGPSGVVINMLSSVGMDYKLKPHNNYKFTLQIQDALGNISPPSAPFYRTGPA